ncbi:MAG: hypothetical protein JWL73_737 [Actinomycetia bacterium]|nr:hypothetical protein [Actinomycetes bacterium]
MTRAEAGSATVLLAGVVALGAVLLLGLARLGGAAAVRARADTAAEVGALAAADQIALGMTAGSACAAARSTVERNGAELLACAASANGARIRVLQRSHGLVARGHARAEIDADCFETGSECAADIDRVAGARP